MTDLTPELLQDTIINIMGWEDLPEEAKKQIPMAMSPLTNWNHTFRLIDKLREKGYRFALYDHGEKGWKAIFIREDVDAMKTFACNKDPKIAILTAATKI